MSGVESILSLMRNGKTVRHQWQSYFCNLEVSLVSLFMTSFFESSDMAGRTSDVYLPCSPHPKRCYSKRVELGNNNKTRF